MSLSLSSLGPRIRTVRTAASTALAAIAPFVWGGGLLGLAGCGGETDTGKRGAITPLPPPSDAGVPETPINDFYKRFRPTDSFMFRFEGRDSAGKPIGCSEYSADRVPTSKWKEGNTAFSTFARWNSSPPDREGYKAFENFRKGLSLKDLNFTLYPDTISTRIGSLLFLDGMIYSGDVGIVLGGTFFDLINGRYGEVQSHLAIFLHQSPDCLATKENTSVVVIDMKRRELKFTSGAEVPICIGRDCTFVEPMRGDAGPPAFVPDSLWVKLVQQKLGPPGRPDAGPETSDSGVSDTADAGG